MIATKASGYGKVLICGGYAILFSGNEGLVVTTSSKFTSEIYGKEQQMNNKNEIIFEYESIQFKQKELFTLTFTKNNINHVNDFKNSKNKYVEETIYITMLYINYIYNLNKRNLLNEYKNIKIEIKLLAHNDFYSQQDQLNKLNLPLKKDSLTKLPKNLPILDLENVAKTGLGSSAAMVTSLTRALIKFFINENKNIAQTIELDLIHRLAQINHAFIQGKIGSGFDISSAILGSMLYSRYDKTVLNPIINSDEPITSKTIYDCINNDKEWNYTNKYFKLPFGFELLCGDIKGGSETPSMSRKVIKYVNDNPDSLTQLVKSNQDIINQFNVLNQNYLENPKEYKKQLQALSNLTQKQWPSQSEFTKLSKLFIENRNLLKQIGINAKVPIEPEEQTNRCNLTMNNCNGCIACGVPGAGGFDAIFALTIGKPENIESYWENTNEILPLLLKANQESGLNSNKKQKKL